MKFLIILGLLFLSRFFCAQNLVPNNEFETFSSCPLGPGEITNVTGWSNPDTATADYFNQCNNGVFPFPSLSVPSNIMGYQQARSGNGYAGIICNENSFGIDTDYREYIQVQLTSPLVTGKEYSVEFYLNLSNTSTHYVEEMGVYFSNTFTNLQQSTALNFVPQVAISGTPLNDTANWTLFSESFVASGGEEFLIIGNFNDPSNTTSGSTGVPSNIFQTGGDFGYYYIEDVSVKEATCFEIEKILVDACGPGQDEGKNEMVTFRVGSQDLNTVDMDVTWATPNSFNGIIQNTTTAQLTSDINNTIVGCGHLIEPTGGVLPAGKEVLLITSTVFDPTLHSFMNLNDTLIVIYHDATIGSGNFSNYNSGGGTRTLTMSFANPLGCSDVVSYERDQLVEQDRVTQGGENGAFVSFTPDGIATYDNLGCQVIGGILSIDISSDINSVCGGENIDLTASVEGDYNEIVWSSSEGTFSSQGSVTTTMTVNNSVSNPFYIYGGVVSNCSDTIKDSVLITINTTPNVSIVATDDTLCTGQNIILTANGASTYEWNNGLSTANPLTITTGGTYTVIGTSGCGSDTVSIFIKELFLGTDTQEDAILCDTNAIHVENLIPCEDCSYQWSDGTIGPNIITPEHNYSVDISNGCGSWTINYGYDDNSVYANFDTNLDSICVGDEVEFTNSSNGGNNNFWDFQNGQTSNTDSILVNVSFEESGDLGVTLIVENNFCKDTIVKFINVSNCNIQTEVIIPNIFTPNGDNLNDEFFIQSINGKNLTGTIFNRWGRKVKDLSGLNATWDGGKNSAGTYYYIIEVEFLDDSKKEYTGIIQLMK